VGRQAERGLVVGCCWTKLRGDVGVPGSFPGVPSPDRREGRAIAAGYTLERWAGVGLGDVGAGCHRLPVHHCL